MRPLLLLVCVALVGAGCTTGSDAVSQAGAPYRYIGSTAKGSLIVAGDRKVAGHVSGDLLNGGTFALAAAAGRVVVVNFWGSWCAPCRTEAPQFDSVYRSVKAEGVDFVGIAVKETSPDDTKAFVRDNGITYPIVYDVRAKTAQQLGRIPALGLPVTVMIDKEQRVAAVYLGAVTAQDIRPAIDRLVHET